MERDDATSLLARRVVTGAGHFLPREKPGAVSSAMLELLAATMKFHPGKVEPTMRLLGSDEVLAKLQAGETGREIFEAYRPQLEHFRKIRAKYLLYK